VRMRAIAGKNLPPVDAGEGVGACVRVFTVVCCPLLGCMTGGLVQAERHRLGGGIGGLPPRGRLLCSLHDRCGSLLRLL
jgi:hypothetical protein